MNYIIILSVAQAKTLKLFLIPHFFLYPNIQYKSQPYCFYIQKVPRIWACFTVSSVTLLVPSTVSFCIHCIHWPPKWFPVFVLSSIPPKFNVNTAAGLILLKHKSYPVTHLLQTFQWIFTSFSLKSNYLQWFTVLHAAFFFFFQYVSDLIVHSLPF